MNSKLVENVLDMGTSGFGGNAECARNGVIVCSTRDQREHFPLSLGQAQQLEERVVFRAASLKQRRNQPAQHVTRDHCATAVYRTGRVDQLGEWRGPREISGGARLHRTDQALLVLVRVEDDDLTAGDIPLDE